ncbi:TetR/AcrR family transcriptional regulator [Rhizobium mulingense]|uniref:TetR/AcrR family transcriptional regulator n=1 Tax=Rhizobium mulingense TaxID=3031128 RepID=UPI002B4A619C|nr:helix-turn-helix domain-containing protein [Rhizobium sp. MJ21]MEB3044751.1 helix-turn-helix domain-containing protein [Rhizobium sp. MJ21]
MSGSADTRKYSSPLREQQALATRERILRATLDLLNVNPFGDISMDDVAKSAGVERRTVFRHFATKEALFDAFWIFINEGMNAQTLPSTLDELVHAPIDMFQQFDKNQGVIRASIHTPAGYAMRMRRIAARRKAFKQCFTAAEMEPASENGKRAEALFHLLYSAGAWEILKDYAGLTGQEAGEAASWAMQVILKAAKPDAQ